MPGLILPASVDFGICSPGVPGYQPEGSGDVSLDSVPENSSLEVLYHVQPGTHFSAQLVEVGPVGRHGRPNNTTIQSGESLVNHGWPFRFVIEFTPPSTPVPESFSEVLEVNWGGHAATVKVELTGETAELSANFPNSPFVLPQVEGDVLQSNTVADLVVEYFTRKIDPPTVTFTLGEGVAELAEAINLQIPGPVRLPLPVLRSTAGRLGSSTIGLPRSVVDPRPLTVEFSFSNPRTEAGDWRGTHTVPIVVTAEGVPAPISPVTASLEIEIS